MADENSMKWPEIFVERFKEVNASIQEAAKENRRAIENLESKIDRLNESRNLEITRLKVDVAMLQVKASMFGGLAGTIGGAIAGVLIGKLLK